MPEGPSLVILKESAEQFKGKKIIEISGNSTIDQQRLLHKKVIEFDTWGKHFLVRFNGFFLRIHFLLFGKYLINDKKDSPWGSGMGRSIFMHRPYALLKATLPTYMTLPLM